MKKKLMPLLSALAVILVLIFGLPAEQLFDLPQAPESESVYREQTPETDSPIDEFGHYTEMEDVALYIHTFGCLPGNFITKDEARELGWEGGSLEPYAPGMCIGGDRFGNYEGLLPKEQGRTYTECDIGTLGKDSRGPERIVFSNDGLIFYTPDHYESFEQLIFEDAP